MASAFRNQIHDAVLIPGITATEFINQFMTSYNQLAENVNHTVDPAQDKDTISENMSTLLNINQRDPMEFVSETHRYDLRLEQRRRDADVALTKQRRRRNVETKSLCTLYKRALITKSCTAETSTAKRSYETKSPGTLYKKPCTAGQM